MAQHKVGDRVRIDCPHSVGGFHGKTATILSGSRFGIREYPAGHWEQIVGFTVSVDGVGDRDRHGRLIGYQAHELKPILPLGSWSALEKMLKTDIRKLRETVEK